MAIPMGVPADHPSTGADGPADAAGSLNERREITANFRPSSASPSPRAQLTLSPYWLSENGGVSTVRATLHRPSSEDTTVTVFGLARRCRHTKREWNADHSGGPDGEHRHRDDHWS